MELLLFHIWFHNLLIKTLDSNSNCLTSDVNKTQNEVLVANITSLWNDLLGSFTFIHILANPFLWYYSLVFRTLYFESEILSSNLLQPSTNCCGRAYPSYVSMSSYTIKKGYNRILTEKIVMYKLKWRKYMVKRILTIDIISIIDSSIISFIVRYCLRSSPWVGT